MKKIAVVSGSDSNYFYFLRGLIGSLRDKPETKEISLCIFDAGLTAEQSLWLAGQGATLAKPRWMFSRPVPSYVALMAARPSIPEYFPGYDLYIWMDADTWLQDSEAIFAYCNGAENSGFCITPELHPSYNAREIALARKQIRAQFGEDVAAKLDECPPINLGVFSGRQDAPHWNLWRLYVHAWLENSSSHQADFNADQEALALVIYADGVKSHCLPARYNWLCHASTPMASEDGLILLEPVFPYSALGVVHMTLWTKKKIMDLSTPMGRIVSRPLTYRAESLPEDIGSYPDFAVEL